MGSAIADKKGVVQSCTQCGQRNRVGFTALENAARCGNCKATLTPLSSSIEIADEESFAALTRETSIPVLIDFWADWCGPCKMMAPELDRFAASSGGTVAVAKVNTELIPAVAQQFNISAIPTLILFRNGQEIARRQGASSSAQLQSFVSQAI